MAGLQDQAFLDRDADGWRNGAGSAHPLRS
jgi:hypothetical protein